MSTRGRLLGIDKGEGPLVTILWGTYAVFCLGLKVGWGAATALFLKEVGIAWLPVMFVLKAVIGIAASSLYLVVADRLSPGALMIGILGLGLALTGGSWALAAVSTTVSVVSLYVSVQVMNKLFFLNWGTYLAEFYPTGAAKRLFPVIFSGARVGGILGGLVLMLLTGVVGTYHLTLGLGIGAALAIVGILMGRPFLARSEAETPSSRVDEVAEGWLRRVREGIGYVKATSFLKWTVASTILLVVTRHMLLFASNDVFDRAFPDGDQLSAFLGVYVVVGNIVGLVVQLGVTRGLLARFGIAATNQTFAGGLGVASLLLFLVPGLGTALGAKFAEAELRTSMKVPVHNLLYTAIPATVRARARALSSGIVVPLATVIAALALMALERLDIAWAITGTGLLGAMVYNYVTARQNKAYLQVLQQHVAEAMAGAQGPSSTVPTAPAYDIDQARTHIVDPAMPFELRVQGALLAKPRSMDRADRDAVVMALAEEVRTLESIEAAVGSLGRWGGPGRLLVRASGERRLRLAALLGVWLAPRSRSVLLPDGVHPCPDLLRRLEDVGQLLPEFLSAEPTRAARHLLAPMHPRPGSGRTATRGSLTDEQRDWIVGTKERWLVAGLALLQEHAAAAGTLDERSALQAAIVVRELFSLRAPSGGKPLAYAVQERSEHPAYRALPLDTIEAVERAAWSEEAGVPGIETSRSQELTSTLDGFVTESEG